MDPNLTPTYERPPAGSAMEAIQLREVEPLGPVTHGLEEHQRTIVLIQPSRPPSVVRHIDYSVGAVLGRGSYGTIVFRGLFKGRTVAVKRAFLDYVTLISHEVKIIQASDSHPNVAQYYYHETDPDFLYLAVELCAASLVDVFRSHDHVDFSAVAVAIAHDPKPVLRQITAGLDHLHTLNIIHRDLKPENVLMAPLHESAGERRWLISDFSMWKRYEYNPKVSHLDTSTPSMAIHTLGWRAPEVIRGKMKYDSPEDELQWQGGSVAIDDRSVKMATSSLTKSLDIFALGCLYYYVPTGGLHPFGHVFEREANILRNVLEHSELPELGEEGDMAMALIKSMLNPEPDKRPDTRKCSMHPYFWGHEKRMAFLGVVLDGLQMMYEDPMGEDSLALEKGASEVVGGDWHSRLDRPFIENLDGLRKYDGTSVRDLLRMLRDVKRDYRDLPDAVKRHLGTVPEDALAGLMRQFPKLLVHVYDAVLSATSVAVEWSPPEYSRL